MPNYKLTIEYDGGRYAGWQIQRNTPKTIQGRLLEAARDAFGEADLQGAGRTDAGVHALAQVASLRVRRTVRPGAIARELNDRLPSDINVLDVESASEAFHPRHDATLRVYLYQIATRRTAFAKPYVWWVRDRLDLAAMRDALSMIAGMNDFTRLSDRRSEKESTKVGVEIADIDRFDDLIVIRLGASHFLWKMVRKIVSVVVAEGRGEARIGTLGSLVRQRGERWEPSAPASGLFLESVLYGDSFDRPLAPAFPLRSR